MTVRATPFTSVTRRGQQLLALLVATMLVLSTGARVQPAQLDLGETVSVIVSKLNPFDRTPEATVERMGGEVTQDLSIVNGFSAEVPEKLVPRLASTPNVLGVRRNGTVRMEGQYGENSGTASAVYTDVHRASKTWTSGYTGQGVNVAIIDTGVNTDGDLAGQVLHSEDFTPEQDHRDNYGHGTFIAGLIAGSGAGSAGAVKGMAPGSKIVSVKIAGRDGFTDVTRLLAALQWVATYKDAYGIRVLNLSLGTTSTQSYKVDPLNFAVERLWNAGIVVVVAAGNKGPNAKTVMKPGDDPFVITVGASDDKTTVGHGDDALAGFSSRGPTVDGIAKPEIVASGKSVVSSRAVGSNIDTAFPNAQIGDRYFKGSGTSFSSAVVAGAAALMISKDWSLGPNRVKARLVETARAGLGGANVSGAGEIDAYGATFSTSTTLANQGIAPAGGGGSLQLSRGGNPVYNPDTGAVMTDEEANAALGFNPNEYFANTWSGSTWNGSTWNGSTWNGTQWNGSTWNGSTWNGSTWNGSTWNGSTWNGSTWNSIDYAGSTWNSSQWTNQYWAGSTWNGSTWNGSTWNGSTWNGSTWNGSTWNGSTWNGSTWNGSTWNGSTWNGSTWNGSTWNDAGWSSVEWSGSQWY